MADAKLTALTAASALAGADLFYVSQSAASRKATGTQLLALVGTTYVPLAGGTMTGALTIASGTLTASAPALNISMTANGPGVVFSSSKITVTNTSSAEVRNFELVVGGVTKYYINENGEIYWGGASGGSADPNWVYTKRLALTDGTTRYATDAALYRDAAATLAQRNGTTQQIFRLYNTYTDASNYERLTLTGVAGTSVNITAETLGTGGDNLDLVLTPAGTGTVKTSVFAAQVLYAGIPGVTVPVVLSYNGNIGLSMGDTSRVSWSSNSEGQTAADAGFARTSAGIVEVNSGTAGTWRDLKLRNLIQTEYSQLTEMTAPAAPATNSVRIYAEDNGAGKTRLMALFATGAAQQIAIEP